VTYLIDSDWVSSYLNGRPEAVELLASLRQDGLAISLVTCGEIYEGSTLVATLMPMSERFGSSYVVCRCSPRTVRSCASLPGCVEPSAAGVRSSQIPTS
jgi:hypothetical protein